MYNHPYTKLLWEERDGRKRGEKDWLLIVLWLINKAIDQSVCSRRGTYMGSWTVWNNLSSRGVNPSKRGGCGLIVRWVRGMGGFLHHAEMINAAVRLCHKHNSCSKRLNGYEWFLCVCARAYVCNYERVTWRRCRNEGIQDVRIWIWGIFTQESKKTSDCLKNSSSCYLYWQQRRLKTMQYTRLHGKSNIFHEWLLHTVWVGLKLSQ